jgi:hypothetical protein
LTSATRTDYALRQSARKKSRAPQKKIRQTFKKNQEKNWKKTKKKLWDFPIETVGLPFSSFRTSLFFKKNFPLLLKKLPPSLLKKTNSFSFEILFFY